MKELIESIENQIKFNSNVVISKDDANKLLQALTSVKSESVEEVLEQKQITLSEYIKLKHTQEECIGFIDGYDRAMHDFANNSEAMKQHAMGFKKDIIRNIEKEINKLSDAESEGSDLMPNRRAINFLKDILYAIKPIEIDDYDINILRCIKAHLNKNEIYLFDKDLDIIIDKVKS